MPLDQQIRSVIEAARAANAPRTDQLPLSEARALFRERYRARSVPVDGSVAIRGITIPTAEGDITARLYRPAGGHDEVLPLIVYFHGGGFVLGDADAYEPQSTVLAGRSGCLVLFVEYRLAPEFRFPAAINDAIATVQWATANARELGADIARLAVMGDSAGANLAINVCLAARGNFPASIALQCLLYPAVDYRYLVGPPSYPSLEEFASGFLLDRATRQWFFDQYFSDPSQAMDPRASVVTAENLAGLPPTVVFTAECDPLRDPGRVFFDRLLAQGTNAEYRCVEGMIHNFLGYSAISDVARCTLYEIGGLLRARLHRSSPLPGR